MAEDAAEELGANRLAPDDVASPGNGRLACLGQEDCRQNTDSKVRDQETRKPEAIWELPNPPNFSADGSARSACGDAERPAA